MRRLLLFILPILIVVAAAFTIFGYFQVRFEEERLIDDLKRKSKHVAESMELSAQGIFTAKDMRSAAYLVEKFETRERLQGCVLYDGDGNVVAITSRFNDWKEKDKPYLKNLLSDKTSRGELERFKEYTVYSYILPVINDEGQVLGLIEVIYDTSYVLTRLTELWKRISITLVVLAVVILIIAVFLHQQIFALPVQRLTSWFTHFQKGETDEAHPIREKGELGKLAGEVEQVALSLRIARRTVSDKASERLQKEETWTESKLKDLVRAKLGENALFVVSNREPYMHVIDDPAGAVKCIRPASGVVTAIHPILCACGGTWLAHGAGDADRKFVNSKDKLGVPPEDNRYILKRIWLNKEEEDGYYYGFANEGLWPLCHNTHTRPIFRETDWSIYKKVNRRFADSLLEELPAKNPFIFIQDYHFTLLGRMIKEKRPDATIALFWHIPWPNPDSFAICPYHREILDGMLGCDLIGFHLQNHCNNFFDTVNRLLESRLDAEKFSIIRSDKETFVRPFPISIDGSAGAVKPRAARQKIERLKQEFDLAGKIVGLGVDRIDYTKGLTERVLAIDRFLEKYPEYRKKFVFVQLAAPSRIHIKRYRELMTEIDELVEKKNWKYMDGNWKPIVYLRKHFSADEIRPFYELADLCIVSSLHDGMNLVAKEYVAAKRGRPGSLILSKFAGSSKELADAVQINPYSIEEFADSIKAAVEMPYDKKAQRMENMWKVVSENNIYRWAADIVTELTAIKKS